MQSAERAGADLTPGGRPMMTRLVLVGIVAALGISVPTRPEVQGWVMAAHSWTAHQLADWDTGGRRTMSGIILPPFVEAVRTFEPIAVDDRAPGLADELNRFGESEVIVSGPAPAGRTRADDGHTPASAETAPIEFSTVPLTVVPETKWLAELWLDAERSRSATGSAEAPVAGRRVKAKIPAECVFTPSVPASSPAEPSPAFESRSLAVAVVPLSALIEPLAEAEPDIAGDLNRFGEGFDVAPPTATPTAMMKSRFEPIDPAAAVDTGLAYELERVSDGAALAWSEADETGDPEPELAPRPVPPDPPAIVGEPPAPPAPSPEVTHAIRLTGHAVHAWMRILAGPAGVRVSVR
jgi:hypothetical protein